MKQAANIITLSRIPLSIGILFTTVFSPLFYVLYVVAGISDILDGIVARKIRCETEMGSKLDSTADIVMVAVCMVKILPYANIKVAGTIVCALASLASVQDWYILLVKAVDVPSST